MRVAVVGCGLIGRKRANVVRQSSSDELVVVADVDESRARALAKEMSCLAVTDWHEVVARNDVQAVVVSTVNKSLMPITVAALERGKHVLVEKPMARNLAEAEAVVQTAYGRWQIADTATSDSPFAIRHQPSAILAVGFNLRHHPAIRKAHELCISGAIGTPMFIRAVYGHGGRPGYDKEWRADPDLAGGGELLDQGVHIVDLCRWFLGEFAEVFGSTATYFWDLGYFEAASSKQQATESKFQVPSSRFQSPISNYPTTQPPNQPPNHLTTNPPRHPSLVTRHQLEDNAFAILTTANGQVATIHTSWTQWKNRFTFEVFGRKGYAIVDGLGGSYGVERLIVGKRKAEGGAPEEQVFEFSERSGDPDMSWQAEWEEFTASIREKRQPLANGEDGLKAMQLIAAIYESSRTGGVVRLEGG